MRHSPYPSGGHTPHFRRRRLGTLPVTAALAGLLSLATFADLPSWDGVAPVIFANKTPAKAPGDEDAAPLPANYASLFDPTPLARTDQLNLRSAIAAMRPATRVASAAPVATGSIRIASPLALPPERPARVAVVPQPMQLAEAAPLPIPRPADLQLPKAVEPPRAAEPARMAETPRAEPELAKPVEKPRLAARTTHRRNRLASVETAPVEDNRSFIEKLFGLPAKSGPSYASLNTNADVMPRRAVSASPMPNVDGATAVYDISAATVTLPSGERLEAHSGLRDKLDDPRYVGVRMQGATPPGTYDLTEREALFHGVRALRLNPVGGSGAVFGRAGLLAHTYMLGPNGDSNGCVSFRDYNRFLQAYLRGEVRRLVVVAGRGQDGPFGNRRFGTLFGTPHGSNG